MKTTLDGFHQALDENWCDWTTRLIMADWYREQGSDRIADAIVWQVKRKKRPLTSTFIPRRLKNVYWRTLCCERSASGRADGSHNPPKCVWDLLRKMAPYAQDYMLCYYYTRRSAEEHLWVAHALWKMKLPFTVDRSQALFREVWLTRLLPRLPSACPRLLS